MIIEELRSNIKWWESKRWIYNVAVGICGYLPLYNSVLIGEYCWSNEYIIGIIVWGIGANIFYSIGILGELFDWYYLENKFRIKRFRAVFFITGFLFSCFLTLMFGWLYFAKPFLW
jgi:hypothetical protein